MVIYKRIGFWSKLIIASLDTMINVVVVYLLSLMIQKDAVNYALYYAFLSLTILFVFSYFYFLPLFLNNKTLTMVMFRVTLLNEKYEQINYRQFVLRSLYLSGIALLVLFIILIFFSPNLLNRILTNQPLSIWDNIAYSIPSGFVSIWAIFSMANLMSSLFSKTQKTLIDTFSGFSLHKNKGIEIEQDNELQVLVLNHKPVVWKDAYE